MTYNNERPPEPTPPRSEPRTKANELRDWLSWAGKRLAGVPEPWIVDVIEADARAAHPTAASTDALRAAAQAVVGNIGESEGDLYRSILALDAVLAATPPSAHPATGWVQPPITSNADPERNASTEGNAATRTTAHPATEGLDVDVLAAAMNDANIDPDELRLGRDLRPVAARILARLSSPEGREKPTDEFTRHLDDIDKSRWPSPEGQSE